MIVITTIKVFFLVVYLVVLVVGWRIVGSGIAYQQAAENHRPGSPEGLDWGLGLALGLVIAAAWPLAVAWLLLVEVARIVLQSPERARQSAPKGKQ